MCGGRGRVARGIGPDGRAGVRPDVAAASRRAKGRRGPPTIARSAAAPGATSLPLPALPKRLLRGVPAHAISLGLRFLRCLQGMDEPPQMPLLHGEGVEPPVPFGRGSRRWPRRGWLRCRKQRWRCLGERRGGGREHDCGRVAQGHGKLRARCQAPLPRTRGARGPRLQRHANLRVARLPRAARGRLLAAVSVRSLVRGLVRRGALPAVPALCAGVGGRGRRLEPIGQAS
mmetsp:Transcript_90044/g.259620  ORF Transcript_90044/g.259620 Transcript_90044/m.259620 type:complete len:230 (+) Transcript_90044:295-984(+)